MDREVYARMGAVEDRHWWFVARRRILAAVLERIVALPPGARLLEAGCGTGGNLSMLERFGEVAAFEPDGEARRIAMQGRCTDVRVGRLPGPVPFDEGAFDLVAALDVLEHIDDDTASLRALHDQLRPGGWLLLTVPAFAFLWSRHDELHHHKRRYRKAALVRQVRAAGFTPVEVTYFNTLLFPLIAGVRMLKKLFGIEGGAEDALPPAPVNRLLQAVFACERWLVGRVPMPAGVSILMVARRGAE